jgi:hypothetical protein
MRSAGAPAASTISISATERGEERKHLGRRVGLHGIEHLRIRQRLGEGQIVFAHDVEIDDEAGAVLGPLTQELADARGH